MLKGNTWFKVGSLTFCESRCGRVAAHVPRIEFHVINNPYEAVWEDIKSTFWIGPYLFI